MPDKKPKYQTLPEVIVKAKKKPSRRAVADETYLPKPKILPRKPGVDSGFRAPYEPEQYVNYPFKHYETLPEVVVHSKTKNKYKTLPNVTVTSKKKSPIKQAVESTGIQMYNPDTKRIKSTANPGQTKSQIKQSTSNIKGNSLKDSVKELTAITQFAPMPLISIPSAIINSGIGMSDMIEARKRGDILNENINSAGAMPWQYMIPGLVGKGLEAASAAADLTDNFGLEQKKNGGWLDNYGKKENANEGHSSASKEWMGEGYSNVGRNYSPAWGGQFAEGGSLSDSGPGDGKFPFPIYSQPTRLDSLFLLNNNKIIKKLLDSGKYDWIKDKKEKTGIKKINPKDWKQKFEEKKYFFDNDIPNEIKKKTKKKGKLSDYRQQKDKFIGTSDWAGGGGDDYGFPMQYIHPDIAPQYEGDLFPISGDMENSPFVYSFGYDELAITPWDMLTPQQQKERLKKYGVSGTPYTEPEEPSLKKKVTKMEPKSSNSKSTTPQLRTIENPNIEMSGSVPQGKYRTSYYDPEMKDWNERAFMTQKESDQFADEMSKRGYPGAYGNVTQRTQFQTGGTLSTIFTDNPNDPRLKRYSDSSIAYNHLQRWSDLVNTPGTTDEDVKKFFSKPDSVAAIKSIHKTNIRGKHIKEVPLTTKDSAHSASANVDYLPKPQPVLYRPNPELIPFNIQDPTANLQLRTMQHPNMQMSGAVPQGNWNVEYLDPDSKKTETKHFISNEDAEQFYNDPANKASRKYSNASSVGRMQLGGNVYPVNYVPQAQNGVVRPSFEDWYKTVPLEKNDTSSYNLRRAYELAPQEQLDAFAKDPNAHLTSVYENPQTGVYEFMKRKDHPTLQKELDWFNSKDREAKEFRKNYTLDTSGDYYKYVPKHAMGGSIPGSVGFTYTRTNSPAPSNGPYAKKTKASAQNGQEMKYYQNGLDWKPKTISKNGGWLNKYVEGGVIKDDMGQWAHPGEITEIGSNRITMQGVPYPVLGISDTGDQQMMYPGEEYKFKGKKVTEFPITQKVNKKENGGWLSQYK